jgi:hypothetical protein
MTRAVPGREGGAARLTGQTGPAAPVTLVLLREAGAGHEDAFENWLRRATSTGSHPAPTAAKDCRAIV